MGQRLQSMAQKLCGGSLTPLLTHLVRTHKLSSQERQQLRQLIDELDQGKGKRRER
jgi:predicted transcriptional regulator